jgi:hypothetical protein
MDGIPLSQEDRAILELESPTVAGHVCKVLSLPAPPDLGALRDLVAARIRSTPALTRRLGGTAAAPAWVPDPDFDVAQHVGAADPDALAAADLPSAVARLFERRLDRSRPLWRMDVVTLPDGSGALVWRIHHAVADGTTAMRYTRELLLDPAVPEGKAHPAHSASRAIDDARRRAHLAGFLDREVASSRRRSPFDGRIGTRRRVAFASVDMRVLHDAAKAIDGAPLNDALLTVVAGALRRWLEHVHGSLGAVRVRVPVSLHHEGDDAGNRDSFFSVGLPVGEPDPVARLRAIHAATAVRKTEHDAEEMDTMLRELAVVSPRLERFWSRIEESPRRFAVSVSNVPGPSGAMTMLGERVHALHSLAEIGARHALRIAAVSFAGRLCLGFCADPGLVDDLEVMAGGAEADAAALVEAAG